MAQQYSKQSQVQTQQQVQTLSPQQILAVKLLELPTVELEDRVHTELLENPALEEGREEPAEDTESAETEDHDGDADGGDMEYNALDDYRDADDIPDYKLQDHNRSHEERAEEIPFSEATSFYENLKAQLGELLLNGRQRELAEYILGSLDDDGLLRKSLRDISDELAIYAGIEATDAELEEAIRTIQSLDPPGIGARSLQECLLLQIDRKRRQGEEEAGALDIQQTIIRDYYYDFTRKRWDRIRQRLDIGDDEFQQAMRSLTKLNPRPGASMGETLGKNLQHIVPDFIVSTDEQGNISFTLNSRNVPELRLNRDYIDMLSEQGRKSGRQTREQKDAMTFLKQKLDSAQSFIDAVRQRQHTLTVTMQAIIDLQKPFFLEGDESLLNPMILKDVAQRTGLDISTISRVSNSKYVQTDFGIFALKFFFSDGYTTQDGEELSVRKIKSTLQELIDGEDRQNPLTDDEIEKLLKQKGFPIARRTIAKYRQQLGIPVARLRR